MIGEKLEAKYDAQVKQLSEKEQVTLNKAKTFFSSAYKFIKPIIIAIFLFTLFTKLKAKIGWEDTIFVLLVTIVVFLRYISSKLG